VTFSILMWFRLIIIEGIHGPSYCYLKCKNIVLKYVGMEVQLFTVE
jgi:hypothetical protein